MHAIIFKGINVLQVRKKPLSSQVLNLELHSGFSHRLVIYYNLTSENNSQSNQKYLKFALCCQLYDPI